VKKFIAYKMAIAAMRECGIVPPQSGIRKRLLDHICREHEIHAGHID
jgi:hypothetical protein